MDKRFVHHPQVIREFVIFWSRLCCQVDAGRKTIIGRPWLSSPDTRIVMFNFHKDSFRLHRKRKKFWAENHVTCTDSWKMRVEGVALLGHTCCKWLIMTHGFLVFKTERFGMGGWGCHGGREVLEFRIFSPQWQAKESNKHAKMEVFMGWQVSTVFVFWSKRSYKFDIWAWTLQLQ